MFVTTPRRFGAVLGTFLVSIGLGATIDGPTALSVGALLVGLVMVAASVGPWVATRRQAAAERRAAPPPPWADRIDASVRRRWRRYAAVIVADGVLMMAAGAVILVGGSVGAADWAHSAGDWATLGTLLTVAAAIPAYGGARIVREGRDLAAGEAEYPRITLATNIFLTIVGSLVICGGFSNDKPVAAWVGVAAVAVSLTVWAWTVRARSAVAAKLREVLQPAAPTVDA